MHKALTLARVYYFAVKGIKLKSIYQDFFVLFWLNTKIRTHMSFFSIFVVLTAIIYPHLLFLEPLK